MRPIETAFPSILAHEGTWQGEYRHVDLQGLALDTHRAQVVCEFPSSGPWAYVQHNRFDWPDGRRLELTLPGRLEGQTLLWDVPTFSGRAWPAGEGLILLRVDRKDEPGVHFIEVIVPNAAGDERVRTWHWFRGGVPFKRTLCHERKVAGV